MNYESAVGGFPPTSILIPPTTGFTGKNWAVESSWSISARIAPYLEAGPMFNSINFSVNKGYSAPENTTVQMLPVKTLLCPSDPTPSVVPDDKGVLNGVTDYGFLVGEFYVYSTNGPPPRSAFGLNVSHRLHDFTDGLSNSLLSSEGYVSHPQVRDCGAPSGFTPTTITPDTNTMITEIYGFATSCAKKGPLGHTRWANGGVYYSGITTALTPNTKIGGACTVTIMTPGTTSAGPWDYVSVDENNGGPTYAALTASSYHPGGVNTLFGDGSVRFIKDSVNGSTWRALGTIAGGEVISGDSY